MKKFLLVCTLIIGFTSSVLTQAINKGDIVTPRFSRQAIKFDKIKILSAHVKYEGTVTKGPGETILINGANDWATSDFPLMYAFKVKDIQLSPKKQGKILLISDNFEIELTINSDAMTPNLIDTLLFRGSPSAFAESDYFTKISSQLLPKVFNGKLSSLSTDRQLKLLEYDQYYSPAISEIDFREKPYLSTSIDNQVVYNTIQLNQAERAARQTNDALKRLREVYAITGTIDNVEGIRVGAIIYSRDFLREEYLKPHEEIFEMYVPFSLLKKFVDSEITNQDLADGSIILVDKSRVKVSLTNFS